MYDCCSCQAQAYSAAIGDPEPWVSKDFMFACTGRPSVQYCRACRHEQRMATHGVPAHLVFPELRLAAAGQAKGVKEGATRVAVVHGLELAALAQPVVLGAGLLKVHQPLGLHPAGQHYLDEQQGRCAAETNPISHMYR